MFAVFAVSVLAGGAAVLQTNFQLRSRVFGFESAALTVMDGKSGHVVMFVGPNKKTGVIEASTAMGKHELIDMFSTDWAQACALRELREETGFIVNVAKERAESGRGTTDTGFPTMRLAAWFYLDDQAFMFKNGEFTEFILVDKIFRSEKKWRVKDVRGNEYPIRNADCHAMDATSIVVGRVIGNGHNPFT